ncbi:MAG: transglycosylase SLT domain-containing protein [Deltaproteobacteria bacterium]|nr:transglycosylase SLT domain-containing protein [Deltaproteobacteria bacterium]
MGAACLALLLAGGSGFAGATPEAVRAFEQGRYAEALALAVPFADQESDSADTARLVVAFARLRLGQDATPALDALEARGPRLGVMHDYLRAVTLGAARRCGEAAEAAGVLPPESAFVAVAWHEVAGCYLLTGQFDAAQSAATRVGEAALSDTRKAEAMLLQARITELRGDRKHARDTYRELVVQHPLSAAARHAGERLGELEDAGMRVRPLTPAELLPRAGAERASLFPGRARRTYGAVLARAGASAGVRHAAELALAELDIVDRRYQKALQRAERVLAQSADPELRAHALYLEGDILSRRGEAEAALALYEQATADHPETAFAAEAALSAARLAYGTRQLERARFFCEWLLGAPVTAKAIEVIAGDGLRQPGRSNSALKDQALWMLAWIERRRGGADAVVDSYLAQVSGAGALADAALYWRARLAVDAGNLTDAEVFADMVVQRAPTSYYALAAADLMSRVSPACDVRVGVSAIQDPAAAIPSEMARDLTGAVLLFKHGLVSESQRTIKLLPTGGLALPDRVAAAWLHRRCGNVHLAHVLTRSLADRTADVTDPLLLGLAYPRAYAEIVTQVSAGYGVPSGLIYAVIRQESAFNPRAISPRRARGLMQMIRPTATRMAREAEIDAFRQRHLFEPEIAIQLGTHYLAGLLERYDGNVVAAVAAYHAGETAVDRWMASRGTLDADELIEEIPYASTRGYVKKVLGAFGVYRLLYQEEPGPALLFSANQESPG